MYLSVPGQIAGSTGVNDTDGGAGGSGGGSGAGCAAAAYTESQAYQDDMASGSHVIAAAREPSFIILRQSGPGRSAACRRPRAETTASVSTESGRQANSV